MIQSPGLRKKARSRHRVSVNAALNLTSLVDVLAILVVYCLLDFHPPGELLT
jgi:hypothetical protein